MAKHVGIVACSAEGAALCYRTLCTEAAQTMGEHLHPEVTMHTYPLGQYMQPIYEGDWDPVAELMLASARIVVRAGAEILVCPDNTLHQAFDRMIDRSPGRWLHIAGEVAAEAERSGFGRIGVLGTRYLMEGPVYRDRLERVGLEHVIPAPQDREFINQTIFDDLVMGRFSDEARAKFGEIIKRLAEQGCDAVVLGCTEIPLLVTPGSSALPTLDSTRILARAALRAALE